MAGGPAPACPPASPSAIVPSPVAVATTREHIQFPRKLNVLSSVAFVAFSDGKPVSTPDQVRGKHFPENALAAPLAVARQAGRILDRRPGRRGLSLHHAGGERRIAELV